MMIAASAVAYDSSYQIICADARRPPKSAYLLLDDQPASTMP